MIRTPHKVLVYLGGALLLLSGGAVVAAVGADEAAKLRTTLTPLGAERAGNKEGTIPAWTGSPTAGGGLTAGGRRADPFAGEKPLFSVDAKNMAQYSEHLTEGVKAVMQKYPDFRIDVYKTYRTGVAPQAVYDNTFKNATVAKLVEGAGGLMPKGAHGGIPFPIPKSGEEVMWNHALNWRGENWYWEFKGYQLTKDGRWLNVNYTANDQSMPYYSAEGSDKVGGDFSLVRSMTKGPAIRAGEGITGRQNLDPEKNQTWVYVTGQRRVRKLPQACCDTPGASSGGVVNLDEVGVFLGRIDRFDWKLIGKREMYIPYNSNRTAQPTTDAEVLGLHTLNPNALRWELHRVWVVEAALKAGKRHVSPKGRYYVDEDTWAAVLAERYDAQGQLVRVPFGVPMVLSEVPATSVLSWGLYDLVTGLSYVTGLVNEGKAAYKLMPPYKDATFTPDAMSGDGVR